jgi:hypothetical protein
VVGVERLKPGNGLPIPAEKKPTHSFDTGNASGPPDDETAARLKDFFAKEAGNPDALADRRPAAGAGGPEVTAQWHCGIRKPGAVAQAANWARRPRLPEKTALGPEAQAANKSVAHARQLVRFIRTETGESGWCAPPAPWLCMSSRA